jgi:hypothetical protein
MMPSLAMIIMMTREENEPDEIELQIIISIDERVLAQIPITVPFQTGMKARFIATVQGMVFTELGNYQFRVHRGDEAPLAFWMVQVKLVPGQPQIQSVETTSSRPSA